MCALLTPARRGGGAISPLILFSFFCLTSSNSVSPADMVLSGRPDPNASRSTSFSFVRFTGADDENIKRFFFVFLKVLAHGGEDKEKPIKLLQLRDGGALEFFYNTFAEKDMLVDEDLNYDDLKDSFLKRFGKRSRPEMDLAVALQMRLDEKNLLESIQLL